MNELTLANDNASVQAMFQNLDISEATRKDYLYRINSFLLFLQTQTFTPDVFLNYKRLLATRTDYSISTKNKYLATARIFLKELNRRGLVPADVTQNIKCFKQSKKHRVAGLDQHDIDKLTAHLRTLKETPQNLRLKAIVSLLLFQGLRQIEVVRLNVEDIDFVAQRAYVLGKGRDDKEPIYLHPETVKALRAYLRACSKAHGALFTPLARSETQRLTTRGLRKIVQQAFNDLDIDKTVHGFRHYFTTRLIESYGGDLLSVARYTRHKNIEMLQVYNDGLLSEKDLPKYYSVFSGASLTSGSSSANS